LKVSDVVHDFGNSKMHSCGGICRVRTYVGSEGVVVLLTDLGDLNDGQSVTNAVEKIIDSVIRKGLVTQSATFIEHYERDLAEFDTFDVVTLIPTTQWKSIKREKVVELIAGDEKELSERSVEPEFIE
tara:strand:+ start:55 stop:438 length:384 start_codon:yes stop_codon:yes gene_type:complete